MLKNTQKNKNNKKKLSCNPSYHTTHGYITSAGTAKSNHDWTRIVLRKQIAIKVLDFATATCFCFFPSGEQELKKNHQKSQIQELRTSMCCGKRHPSVHREKNTVSQHHCCYNVVLQQWNNAGGRLAALQSCSIICCSVQSKLTIDALCDHLKCWFVCSEHTNQQHCHKHKRWFPTLILALKKKAENGF